MEFWTTMIGLLRRRRVIFPAVLVAIALGAAAYVSTPARYVSSTTMVLTTTQFGGTESQDPALPAELTNPMLNFNDSLRTTSAILIQAMGTRDVLTELGVRGPTRMTVNDGRTNPDLLGLNGPFLYIVGQSTTPGEAQRVVVEGQALMREKLQQWQSELHAPEKTYVSLVDVVSPTAPEAQRGRAVKLGLMAFLFGFLLSTAIAYFGHRTRARRAARAAATAAAATAAAPPPEPAAPSSTNGVRPAATRRPARPKPKPTPSPAPPRKNGSSVVTAPVKAKVRPRNR